MGYRHPRQRLNRSSETAVVDCVARQGFHSGPTVSDAAATFGISRQSLYEAKAANEAVGHAPWLLPRSPPGPSPPHKPSEVLVERLVAGNKSPPTHTHLAHRRTRRAPQGPRTAPDRDCPCVDWRFTAKALARQLARLRCYGRLGHISDATTFKQ